MITLNDIKQKIEIEKETRNDLTVINDVLASIVKENLKRDNHQLIFYSLDEIIKSDEELPHFVYDLSKYNVKGTIVSKEIIMCLLYMMGVESIETKIYTNEAIKHQLKFETMTIKF